VPVLLEVLEVVELEPDIRIVWVVTVWLTLEAAAVEVVQTVMENLVAQAS
jgi:hypothetical protein